MIYLLFLGIVVACIVIWKSSDFFEQATDRLGQNMSEGVKGASLNAIASSMPELLTGFLFLFALKGSDGYAGTIGTTAGSAVFNSLMIPGLVILMVTIFGIAKSISVSKKVINRDGIFLLLSEIVLIFVISTNRISYKEGVFLVFIYIVYFVYMFVTMKKKNHAFTQIEDPDEDEELPKGKAIWFLIASTAVMSLACYLLVYCVNGIGEIFNIHLMFVSIILAAAASSIPDTIISLRDAKKGNYDDAVSNAIGSNIFDICIAHGLPLAIYTFIYGDIIMTSSTTDNSLELRVWLLILTAVTILIYRFNKKMGKNTGICLIGLYAVFFMFVIGKALGHQWAIDVGKLITSIF